MVDRIIEPVRTEYVIRDPESGQIVKLIVEAEVELLDVAVRYASIASKSIANKLNQTLLDKMEAERVCKVNLDVDYKCVIAKNTCVLVKGEEDVASINSDIESIT